MHGGRDAPPDQHADELPKPAEFWERRYADVPRAWSGAPNASLVAALPDVPPGRALDLGCGEGADAIWLAQQGWSVTGVDISPTAVARATAAAARAGLAERTLFLSADLRTWSAQERYDLVTASFLQSPVELPRTEVLRRAATFVTPGGHLLVVTHGAPPPWAGSVDHGPHVGAHEFRGPEEEVAALDLPDDAWTRVVVQTRSRTAVGPSGEEATLDDVVVLLRRT